MSLIERWGSLHWYGPIAVSSDPNRPETTLDTYLQPDESKRTNVEFTVGFISMQEERKSLAEAIERWLT